MIIGLLGRLEWNYIKKKLKRYNPLDRNWFSLPPWYTTLPDHKIQKKKNKKKVNREEEGFLPWLMSCLPEVASGWSRTDNDDDRDRCSHVQMFFAQPWRGSLVSTLRLLYQVENLFFHTNKSTTHGERGIETSRKWRDRANQTVFLEAKQEDFCFFLLANAEFLNRII